MQDMEAKDVAKMAVTRDRRGTGMVGSATARVSATCDVRASR